MKKIIKNCTLLLLVFISFWACTKDTIDTFSADDSVYFQWALDGRDFARNQIDSTSISFAFTSAAVQDTVFFIPIKVQGILTPTDREVDVEVADESTAIRGTHFDFPKQVVIPADSVRTMIPLTIYRTPEMKENTFTMKLKLVPNSNFNTNITGTATANNSNNELVYDEFELTISDILNEPSSWSGTPHSFLGDFSPKKLYLFAEVNKIPVPNYDADGLPSVGIFLSQINVFKNYLREQIKNGTPILEEDGTQMTIPRL